MRSSRLYACSLCSRCRALEVCGDLPRTCRGRGMYTTSPPDFSLKIDARLASGIHGGDINESGLIARAVLLLCFCFVINQPAAFTDARRFSSVMRTAWLRE